MTLRSVGRGLARTLFVLVAAILPADRTAAFGGGGSGSTPQIITPHIPYFRTQTKPFVIRDQIAWNANAATVPYQVVDTATSQTVYASIAYRNPNTDFGSGWYYGNFEFATLPNGTYRIVYGPIQKNIAVADNAVVLAAAINGIVRQKRNSLDGHLGVVHADAGMLYSLPANLRNGFNDATDVRGYAFSTSMLVSAVAKARLFLAGSPFPAAIPLFSQTTANALVSHGIDFLLKLQGPYQSGGRDLYWGLTANNYLTDNVPSPDDPACNSGSITNTRRGLAVFAFALGSVLLQSSQVAADRALSEQARTAAINVYNYANGGSSAWGGIEPRSVNGLGNIGAWLLDNLSASSPYRTRAHDRANDILSRQVTTTTPTSLYGYFTDAPGGSTAYFPRWGAGIDHLVLMALISQAQDSGSPQTIAYKTAIASFFDGYILRFMPWRGGNAFGRPPEVIWKNGAGAPSGTPVWPGTTDAYAYWSPTATGPSKDNQFLTGVLAACGPAAELLGSLSGVEIRRAAMHILYGIFGLNPVDRRSVDCPAIFLGPSAGTQIPHYIGGVGNLPGGVPAPQDFLFIQNGFGQNFTDSSGWEHAEWHAEKQARLIEALAAFVKFE